MKKLLSWLLMLTVAIAPVANAGPFVSGQVLTASQLNTVVDSKADNANAAITGGTIAGTTINNSVIGSTTPAAIYSTASVAVAAAGTTQGTATVLTAQFNKITTATDAANGVMLSVPARSGYTVKVDNDTTASVFLYPQIGGTFDGGTANAPITIMAGGSVSVTSTSATDWDIFFSSSALLTAAAPYKNRLINGDMQVSQVNGATAVTPTTTDTYPIDQWKTDTTQASKLTFQQVADAPPGFKYSEKVTVAAQYSPLATDRFAIYQPVEGQNLIDFGLGTASPSTLAMSLWVKCSTAGTYAVGLNNAGTRSYVGTVSCTTAWTKQTVTLVGDNTGTWATDNTIGAQFYIDLGSGSNFNTTAGAWQAGDFTRTAATTTFVNLAAAQTFQVTGVQLEQIPAGATVGTPFEFLAYETQLRRAQRYLPCFNSTSVTDFFALGGVTSTSIIIGQVKFPVDARTPLTGISYSNVAHFTGAQINSTSSVGTVLAFQQANTRLGRIALTGTGTPYTVGYVGEIYFNNAAAQLCFTGAQL